MLKLGYKASAEQFGPRELLEFSVLAEDIFNRGVIPVAMHHFHWRG
jgi:coenzyme F420-dependent glucose-6-phosphate dehydrogenase